MTTLTVDEIEALVTPICQRLELEPRLVASLMIKPREITAQVYKTRNGDKYVGDDGEPAIETTRFLVPPPR